MSTTSPEKNEPTTNTVGSMLQNAKIKLVDTSPETEESKKSVGEMSIINLMNLMQNTMATILDEKLQQLPTKTDFEDIRRHINEVKSDVTNLINENEELKKEVQKLKEISEADQRRLWQLEDEIGRKKLIIRGLASQKSVMGAVKKVYNEKLKIQSKVDIDHARKRERRKNDGYS